MTLNELLETGLITDGDRLVLRFVNLLHMEEVRTGNWYEDKILTKSGSKILTMDYNAMFHEWRITLEPERGT